MKTNKNSKQFKVEKARSAVAELKQHDRSFAHLEELAEVMIAPGEHPSRVFPQRFPGRLGSATFPLVISHQSLPGAPTPEVTIILSPDMKNPLRISRPTVVAPNTDLITGQITQALGLVNSFNYLNPCSVLSQKVGGKVALPLQNDNAAGTIDLSIGNIKTASSWRIEMYRRQGTTWILGWSSDPIGVGVTSITTTARAFNSGSNHIALEFVPVSGGSSNLPVSCDFTITPNLGAISCSQSSYSEHVLDTYSPPWANLLSNSKYARVVAADLLVKYEGSSLENAGSIGVANIDDEFVVPDGLSTYDMVSSRPFDKYVGRLASAGEDPGGCHWHYVPMSEFHLAEDGVETAERLSLGVVGITGLQEEQLLRIVCHFTINFYSESPEYKMRIPPPITGYSLLLWYLRTEIPLTSSNDFHSIVKKVRKGGSKAFSVATDPAVLKAVSALGALLV